MMAVPDPRTPPSFLHTLDCLFGIFIMVALGILP
jgi:hypothetical protein